MFENFENLEKNDNNIVSYLSPTTNLMFDLNYYGFLKAFETAFEKIYEYKSEMSNKNYHICKSKRLCVKDFGNNFETLRMWFEEFIPNSRFKSDVIECLLFLVLKGKIMTSPFN